MPTPSGHTRAITASKVIGTSVYNTTGEKIGSVEDVVLDKMSNEIMFAVVSFGGFLGIGKKFHPLPWARLDYQPQEDGYVVGLSKEALEAAPAYDMADLIRDDGQVQRATTAYYAKYQ
jgi:sporulation protein YlmC with PRC-barrel domain